MRSPNRYFLVAMVIAAGVKAASIEIRTQELPRAIKGVSYTADLAVNVDGRCLVGDAHLALSAGALPPGLNIEYNTVNGIPKSMGSFNFEVRAWNGCSSTTRKLHLFVTGRPILDVSPSSLPVRVHSGERKPTAASFLVSGTWRELRYSISAPESQWLSLKATDGMTPGEGSPFTGDRVVLNVDAAKLAPGTYHQTLTIWAPNAANAPTVDVELQVDAPLPTSPNEPAAAGPTGVPTSLDPKSRSGS